MSGEAVWAVFDLDGTLIESEQIWRDVRHEFVIANGGRWPASTEAAMIGMRTVEWAEYIHDQLGVALAPATIAKRIVQGVVERLQDPPLLPGADAALERLGNAFRLGLASSASLPVVQTVLAKTGWNKYFAVVVSADEVPRGKPAPDVYLRTLALLDADPSRTAAVEDSANGIRSAHAARLAVVAIPNHAFPPDEEALELASRVLPNLDALDVAVIREVLAAP
ncbi:MAG: HAD family phosphatase [Candidatus Cybelea sp.]|jgi:HAD superfamily hydrolase (TIGR01509 family)